MNERYIKISALHIILLMLHMFIQFSVVILAVYSGLSVMEILIAEVPVCNDFETKKRTVSFVLQICIT